MFVHPMRRWAQGAVISTVGSLALFACDDPEQNTSLRPEGAPIVLSVLVSNDPGGFEETATYCRPNDEKRPTFVAILGHEVCSSEDPGAGAEAVTDAVPTNPYVRIQFDELLNPNVEELIAVPDPDTGEDTGVFTGTIANTMPVTLMCGGMAVPYDGYYQPAGNSVTWPVGPGLVVFPQDPSTIAAGSTCTVTLVPDVVVDKQGERATDTQAFSFGIAALEFQGSDPEAEADPADAAVIAPDSPVTLLFNGFADPASLLPAEVRIETVADCTAAVGSGAVQTVVVGGDPGAITIGTVNGAAGPEFAPDTTYLITFPAGADVTDLGGATLELPGAADFTLCVITDAA